MPAGLAVARPVASAPASTWNEAVAALPNLWGWWKLDETAGNGVTAEDASGNERDGTYTAAGTHGSSGLFAGSAASQTTLGGRIILPTYPTAAVPAFTLLAMVQATSSGSEEQIISADNGSGYRAWQFRKRSASSNRLEFVTISPSVTTTTGATTFNDGDPHLAAVVFDQSLAAGDGRVKLYLDGALDGQSTTAITITGSGSAPVGIGTRGANSINGLWGGAMDEAIIVDGALSAAQIAALWAVRNDT